MILFVSPEIYPLHAMLSNIVWCRDVKVSFALAEMLFFYNFKLSVFVKRYFVWICEQCWIRKSRIAMKKIGNRSSLLMTSQWPLTTDNLDDGNHLVLLDPDLLTWPSYSSSLNFPIQQICSRRLWKHSDKNLKNLLKR